MASARSQGGGGNQVVSRSGKQVQAFYFQAFAIRKYTFHIAFAALLGASQSLVFQCGDTTCLVARRRILTYRFAVREEVFFEVVYQFHRFFKQLFVTAAVHQDCFRTEHFGYFRQYTRTALCNEEVGEHAQQRISRNAGESVGTAAFQTYTQFAQRHVHTFVLAGFRVEFAQQFHTFFVFVAHFLRHHELYTVGIVFTQKLAEYIRLVVFASQTYHKHGTCIGVQHHVAQYFLGVFVVIAQLRTAVVVRECHDCIHAFAVCLAAQAFCQLVDNTVYATHRGDNPYFVAYSHIAVFAAVSFKCQVLVRNVQFHFGGVVRIFQQSGKIGPDVVFVHPVALFLCGAGVSYGITVFNYIFAFRKIFQREFMSGGDILVQDDFLAVYYEFFTGRKCCDSHCNVVSRVDFQVLCFHILCFNWFRSIVSYYSSIV